MQKIIHFVEFEAQLFRMFEIIFASPPVDVQSIVISVSVCLSAVFVCLCKESRAINM